MKIIAIIAEYNPFHNGHLYHLNKAMERSKADACIVIMSGDFVQRGEPAIFSKHLRAAAAIKSGASLVIELPVYYSCGSAEYFAGGAVSILNGLGCIDELWFGSECASLEALQEIAEVLVKEPDVYKSTLKEHLKSGLSFPKARQKALEISINKNGTDTKQDISDVFQSPNNLLAIEYLKALMLTKSTIKPRNIQRTDGGYHSESTTDYFSSATSIRKALCGGESLASLEHTLPLQMLQTLQQTPETFTPIYADNFSLIFKYKMMSESKTSLTSYLDINKDLANKLFNSLNQFTSISSYIELLKSKDLTYTRLARAIIHILLNIRADQMEMMKSDDYTAYAHILGFDQKKKKLLSIINNSKNIPLISKLTKTDGLSPLQTEMIKSDIFASDLYQSVRSDKYQIPFQNELQKNIVKI